MNIKIKKTIRSPYVWTFTTYFAEGFPYSLIRTISSVFFRDMRVSLEAIGLTSLFGIPWVIKFLWGPLIDQYATKRKWMLIMQSWLFLMIILVALLAPLTRGIPVIAFLFFIGAFVAATHDIAIDGFYMEVLDEKGQAKFVGYRVMAYRIAMMTGTGVIVSIGAVINWFAGFLCAGLILMILFSYHLIFLPKTEQEKLPISHLISGCLRLRWAGAAITAILAIFFFRWFFSLEWFQLLKQDMPLIGRIRFSGWVGIGLLIMMILLALFKNRLREMVIRDKGSFYSRAFLSYMDRSRIGWALGFIILMRTGESMLSSMAAPFMVDLGIKHHYGWISGGVGLPFSIIGALAGGWMISRYTLKKTIWPFLLAQNITNLIYMLLALHLSYFVTLNTGADTVTPLGALNLLLVASVHAFDQFAGGLGTSVLVTYLMRTCVKEFKAAHFAIGTGLMNISGVLAGVVSGFLAEWLGYGIFFGVSFIASFPGMALVLFAPFMEPDKAGP